MIEKIEEEDLRYRGVEFGQRKNNQKFLDKLNEIIDHLNKEGKE